MKKKGSCIGLIILIILILGIGMYLITKEKITPTGRVLGIPSPKIPTETFLCNLYSPDLPISPKLLDNIVDISSTINMVPRTIPYGQYTEVYLGEPNIYKDNIVWIDHKKKQIILYNFQTREIVEITDKGLFNSSVKTYGDYIVFLRDRIGEKGIPTGIKDVGMYHIPSKGEEVIISEHEGDENADLIIYNNKVAWTETSFYHPDKSIFLYDIKRGTGQRLGSRGWGYSEPDIYRDKMVYIKWKQNGNHREGYSICIYDIKYGKETEITTKIKSAHSPRINSDWIVWIEWVGQNSRIYSYRRKTKEIKRILLPDHLRLSSLILSKEKNLLLINEKKDKKRYTYIYYLDQDKWVSLTTESPIEYGLSIYKNIICWSTGKEISYWRGRL